VFPLDLSMATKSEGHEENVESHQQPSHAILQTIFTAMVFGVEQERPP
jgi:hypothetical protein